MKKVFLISVLLLSIIFSFAQSKGKLFIIGGGNRSAELIQSLIQTADLKKDDYVVVLPMATSEPVESIAYITEQIREFSSVKIASLNFDRTQADENSIWIDSVKNARMIYVTGGDQNKFMKVVEGTKLYTAIHQAYDNGSTIAGTSAGAAIMSQIMITGEQVDSARSIQTVSTNNIITSTGMGFLKTAVIDQHFIIRSRYNRLLSVLLDHPTKTLIGIDEGTALVVNGKKASVVGDSQVVVVSQPHNIRINKKNKVSFTDAKISLFTAGEEFKL